MQKRLFQSVHSTIVTTSAEAGATGGVWQQLLPSGRFSGRTGRGPFDTGDRTRQEKIVAATLKRAGRTELVVDYDHQTVFGAVPKVGGRAPAAGWIKELDVRADGIWGRVEWTEAAAAAIRAGEYRYVSPVFQHDKHTGEVLRIVNLALTNTPDLDLAQVAASAHHSLTELEPDMDEILKALGLSEGSNEDAVLTAINSILANSAAIAAAVGLNKTAKPESVLTAVKSAAAAHKALDTIGTTVKADKNADPDAIVTAVNSAIAGCSGVDPDPAKFVPIAQFKELSNKVSELQTGLATDKAQAAVEEAMSAGKVAPSQKKWALDYARKDLADFETYVASAPVIVDPKPTPAGGKLPATGAAVTNESDQAAMSALGVSKEDFDAARKREVEEQEAV